jgi:DNA repair exonuclease SbcCD ATPase subunit
MEEEQRKIDEEKRRIEEERRRLEEERRKKQEEEERKRREEMDRKKREEEEKMLEEKARSLEEKVRYIQNERRKMEEERLRIQKGNKEMEDEESKIIEEESKNKRIKEINNRQIYDLYSYKDTEIKTFINDYKKSKYKVMDQPFPERKTITISIQNDENFYNNLNENTQFSQIDERRRIETLNENNNLVNNSTYVLRSSSQCPGCGRLINNGLNFVEVENSMCPGCGRMTIQNLTQ